MIKENHVMMLCDFETTGLVGTPNARPIEFACLFLTGNYNVIGHYESLIKYPTPLPVDPEAMRVNGITSGEIELLGRLPDTVITDIEDITMDFNYDRLYLASDNSYFDFHFAKQLGIKGLHYNPVDIKILLHVAGVERPTTKKKHRAMSDVLNLYRSLIIANNILTGG